MASTGRIQFEEDATGTNYKLRYAYEIFDPQKGAADKVSIACCHFDKAVNKKMKEFYLNQQIVIEPVTAPQVFGSPHHEDGEVILQIYIRALTEFFNRLASELERE